MKILKKILVFLLCVILSFSTVACTNAGSTDTHKHTLAKRAEVAATRRYPTGKNVLEK